MRERLWRRPLRAGAQAPSVRPLPGARSHITHLPARPFAVSVSPDGRHAFVSMPRPQRRGLLVLAQGVPWQLLREHWMPDTLVPRGLVTDAGGRYLLVANSAGGLLIADVAQLMGGATDPVVAVMTSPSVGSIQVALHPDQRFAFVTDEDSATVSVFDLGASLASPAPGGRLLGQVPVAPGPVGVACTDDGAHVLVTCQGRARSGGVLSVIPVAQAIDDPSRAIVHSVAAGTDPVRVRLAGELAWVSARGSNALLAFDIDRLIHGVARRPVARVDVGMMPVGLTTVHHDSFIVVANSGRYGASADQAQSLSVIDAQAAVSGRPALVGAIPAGRFPRELATARDDRTVLTTNVLSQTLQTIDLAASLPIVGAA